MIAELYTVYRTELLKYCCIRAIYRVSDRAVEILLYDMRKCQ